MYETKTDTAKTLERILTAPKKQRQAALIAAESALAGNPEPLLTTQAQAARALSCSRFTIRRLVKDGVLHPVSIRGLVRYRYSELRALADQGAANIGRAATTPLR